MVTPELRAIGSPVGMILPKGLLTRLHLGGGDTVQVVETPDGFRVIRHEPEFKRRIEVAREVMHRRRAVLRELVE